MRLSVPLAKCTVDAIEQAAAYDGISPVLWCEQVINDALSKKRPVKTT